MVQSLVTDRFRVKLHRETREMRVYFLDAGKNGVRLKRTAGAAGPNTSFRDGNGFMAATQIDMGILARNLAGELGVPVIDRTSLAGAYDFRLEWNPTDDPAIQSSAPSIFTALQEQLGLRLQSGRGPVEVLVIDHVENRRQTEVPPNHRELIAIFPFVSHCSPGSEDHRKITKMSATEV
jgi:uncharacterized protein (TIGR03435 family)